MNINDNVSIQFIFAKPYIESYYLYGVNSVEELRMIPKTELKTLISENLHYSDPLQLDYFLNRNFAFLYDNTSHILKHFQFVNDVPSKEEIKQGLLKEMQEQFVSRQSPLQRQYSNLFNSYSLLKQQR